MITGFEADQAGGIALLKANEHSVFRYFKPELALFLNRVTMYLLAKTKMQTGLFYPECYKVGLDAEELGIAQGRKWKHPLFLIRYSEYLDWTVEDIREEFGISDVLPPGYWAWTTATYRDPDPQDEADADAGSAADAPAEAPAA
jgi:ubiquinone biosynthesis protein Coq4